MNKLFSRLISSSTPDPSRMRRNQILLIAGVAGAALAAGVLLLGSSSVMEEKKPSSPKEEVKLDTPFEAVKPQDIWVNRIQEEAGQAREEAKAVREENRLLVERLDQMEKAFQAFPVFPDNKQKGPSDNAHSPVLSSRGVVKASAFTPPDLDNKDTDASSFEKSLGSVSDFQNEFLSKPSSRIHHVSLGEGVRTLLKNIDNYVPSGSYARAVLTSGVVASTALQASSQPQPVVLRLVKDARLPRGFESTMKDNVLIAACYGDISSERVMCRLESMSWVNEDGVTVEKKVEGWIVGEDGRPGLRGEVVDRSGEAVRQSMLAGILSGFSGFFKHEAMSDIYPVTPFGQTNAMKGQQALKGAAGSGVGNALDKLAEFSIKRAEQMQPVILIASGRVVDVVFQSGVDIRPEAAAPSLVLGDQKLKEKDHAEF